MTARRREQVITIVLYVALAVLAAGITAQALTTSGLLRFSTRNSIIGMLDGTAEKPYVYRTLLPQVTNLVVSVTPRSLQETIGHGVASIVTDDTFLPWTRQLAGKEDPRIADVFYQYPLTIAILGMYAALLAYGVVLRVLCTAFFQATYFMPWAMAFFGMLMVIPFVDSDIKLYDFPGLALTALCLLYMYRQQWVSYFFWLSLACFNKETAFLTIILFAVAYYSAMEKNVFLKLLFAQGVMYAAITAAIHYVFADNFGNFYVHPVAGVSMLVNDLRHPVHALTLLAFYMLVVWGWNRFPGLLRKSAWLLPIMAAMYYVCGKQGEYRVFFDVFPYVTLMAGYALFSPMQKIKE